MTSKEYQALAVLDRVLLICLEPVANLVNAIFSFQWPTSGSEKGPTCSNDPALPHMFPAWQILPLLACQRGQQTA